MLYYVAPSTTTSMTTLSTTITTTTLAPCLCENGGTCVYVNNNTNICQCNCPYYGTLCQFCKHITKLKKSKINKLII